jgi:hypothetical protein
MAYFILARDGTSRIVLKRENREAAVKKARELTDLGWFDVQIGEEAHWRIGVLEGSRFANGDNDPAGFVIGS